jgi:hypothetical protein
MQQAVTINLTFDQILNFSQTEAEEKSFYIRYLLIRENNEEVIDKYYKYLSLLAGRLDYLKSVESQTAELRKTA